MFGLLIFNYPKQGFPRYFEVDFLAVKLMAIFAILFNWHFHCFITLIITNFLLLIGVAGWLNLPLKIKDACFKFRDVPATFDDFHRFLVNHVGLSFITQYYFLILVLIIVLHHLIFSLHDL